MAYEAYEMGFFLLFYAFLGWCAETVIYAVTNRKFTNVGFLTLPFVLTYGVTMALLAFLLPSFGENLVGQSVMTLIVASTVDRLGNFNIRKLTGVEWPDRGGLFGGNLKGFVAAVAIAFGYFLVYLVLHPLVIFLLPLVPALLLRIATDLMLLLVAADMALSVLAVRRGKGEELRENARGAKLARTLVGHVWDRLDRAYPGIREMGGEGHDPAIFGKGLSLDKLTWVFFLSALLGDGIETLYCGLVDGEWMNRSSVLYGPFSFVWGLGAVVLTVTLLPLAKRNDRWVFLGGFFIGGAYEYLCSVFTEAVFGTVFWDYSDMPLNIGGRTNVLFMCFWGALSVVWVKLIYPRMSGFIEKIPPLAGKIVTWTLTAAMVLNGALTMAAMLRYHIRRVDSEPHSRYEALIDLQYPDSRIESRWPNMIVVEETEAETS